MNEHAWLEAAAAYALGALDEGERAPFEAHLADCPQCRGEVATMRNRHPRSRRLPESVGAG